MKIIALLLLFPIYWKLYSYRSQHTLSQDKTSIYLSIYLSFFLSIFVEWLGSVRLKPLSTLYIHMYTYIYIYTHQLRVNMQISASPIQSWGMWMFNNSSSAAVSFPQFWVCKRNLQHRSTEIQWSVRPWW